MLSYIASNDWLSVVIIQSAVLSYISFLALIRASILSLTFPPASSGLLVSLESLFSSSSIDVSRNTTLPSFLRSALLHSLTGSPPPTEITLLLTDSASFFIVCVSRSLNYSSPRSANISLMLLFCTDSI